MLAEIIRIPILISAFKAIRFLPSEQLFLISRCPHWLQPSFELKFLALNSLRLQASLMEGQALFLIPSPLNIKVLCSQSAMQVSIEVTVGELEKLVTDEDHNLSNHISDFEVFSVPGVEVLITSVD
jgi:hypothetical protein